MELIVLAVLVGGGYVVWSKVQQNGGPDVGWSGRAPTVVAALAEPIPRGSARGVARALGRAESRQLARSFAIAIGIAFSLLIVLLFGIVWSGQYYERWESVWITAPIFAYPIVGMAVIGVHAAVVRERRDGTAELFASCPATPAVRTSGHLRTAWVPVVAIAVFLGLLGAAYLWRGNTFGDLSPRTAGDILAALALGVGGTWLGVAVARWAPWWPAPIVAVVLVGVASLTISGIGEPDYGSPLRQLSTFPRYPDYDLIFEVRAVWWHLGWLLALCAAVALVAVGRDRWDRSVRIASGVAIAALVVTGVGTTRPLDAQQAARVASLVAHPERHQHCLDLEGGAVCTYAGFDDVGRLVADALEPVLTTLPPSHPPLVARQRYDDRIEELAPQVRDRLPQGVPTPPADELALGFTTHPHTLVASRLAAGLWAVDLPYWVGEGSPAVSIAGEAPGVIALWLAARGLPNDEARDLVSAHPQERSDGSTHPLAAGMPWPEPCDSSPSPVVWAPQDLEAARALLGVPEAEVRRILAAEWSTLTGRGTTTDQLMERFGLPSVGPIDDLGGGEWECDY